MRIAVDRDKCVGVGICEATAPDEFEIDDDGDLLVQADPIAPDRMDAVRAAVEACPAHALRLVEQAEE